MRLLIKGTADQVKEVCAQISKPGPRDRSALREKRKADQNRNKAESELMRAAFTVVRNNPEQRNLANSFAAAIYGPRSVALLLAAQRVIDGQT